MLWIGEHGGVCGVLLSVLRGVETEAGLLFLVARRLRDRDLNSEFSRCGSMSVMCPWAACMLAITSHSVLYASVRTCNFSAQLLLLQPSI